MAYRNTEKDFELLIYAVLALFTGGAGAFGLISLFN